MIEMIMATLILTSAIVGLGASAGYMIQSASVAGVKSEALQAVEGRISQIVMDPRYSALDSLYGGTETDLPGLEGHARVTAITHTRTQSQSGGWVDYKTVMVSVSGPGLPGGLSRTMTVGAP